MAASLSDIPLPPGFELEPQMPPIPNGWEPVVTPAKQAEMREYKPTWRDNIARLLLGDEKPSAQRERAVDLLLGSHGLGKTGVGAVDFTPLGIPLAGDEGKREADKGNWTGATINAMAMIPAAKPGAMGLKAAMQEAADRAAATSAERATKQSTLRAKGVSHTQLPYVHEGDQLVRNPDYTPMRGRYYDDEFRPGVQRPNDQGISPSAPIPPPQPGMQRVYDPAADAYSFRPTRPVEPIPQVGRAQMHDGTPHSAEQVARINTAGGPAIKEGGAIDGAVWMINPRTGEVRNSQEVAGKIISGMRGGAKRDADGWQVLYDPRQGRKYLTPDEMKASRAMWGNPSGSLWDNVWMPSEAPPGVKEAVKSIAENPGRKWGDVLADLVEQMKKSGMPEPEVAQQFVAIVSQVSRNLALNSAPKGHQ